MFVLCVVRNDKRQKCRTVKTKNQVWMTYRVQGNTKNPGVGEIFRTRRNRPCGPPVQWVPGLFPGGKSGEAWRGVNTHPPYSTEAKERVELYLCSVFGLIWAFRGPTLPLS